MVYSSIILNIAVHGKTATMFKVKLGSLHQLECFYFEEWKSPEPNRQMLSSTMIPVKSMVPCLTPHASHRTMLHITVFWSGILYKPYKLPCIQHTCKHMTSKLVKVNIVFAKHFILLRVLKTFYSGSILYRSLHFLRDI